MNYKARTDSQSVSRRVFRAFQMTFENRINNESWPNWLNRAWNKERNEVGALFPSEYPDSDGKDQLILRTKHGLCHMQFDDYIIQHADLSLSVCDRKVFEDTFERVDEQAYNEPQEINSVETKVINTVLVQENGGIRNQQGHLIGMMLKEIPFDSPLLIGNDNTLASQLTKELEKVNQRKAQPWYRVTKQEDLPEPHSRKWYNVRTEHGLSLSLVQSVERSGVEGRFWLTNEGEKPWATYRCYSEVVFSDPVMVGEPDEPDETDSLEGDVAWLVERLENSRRLSLDVPREEYQIYLRKDSRGRMLIQIHHQDKIVVEFVFTERFIRAEITIQQYENEILSNKPWVQTGPQ